MTLSYPSVASIAFSKDQRNHTRRIGDLIVIRQGHAYVKIEIFFTDDEFCEGCRKLY
jgi:hypothetical protein